MPATRPWWSPRPATTRCSVGTQVFDAAQVPKFATIFFQTSAGGTLGGGIVLPLGTATDTLTFQGQLAGAVTLIDLGGGITPDVLTAAVTPTSNYHDLTFQGGFGFDNLDVFIAGGGVGADLGSKLEIA